MPLVQGTRTFFYYKLVIVNFQGKAAPIFPGLFLYIAFNRRHTKNLPFADFHKTNKGDLQFITYKQPPFIKYERRLLPFQVYSSTMNINQPLEADKARYLKQRQYDREL